MWQNTLNFVVLAYLTSLQVTLAPQEACSLNVDDDIVKTNQPLMVTKNGGDYELVLPEKIDHQSLINMTKNDRLLLFCPGQDNALKILGDDYAITECNKDRLQVEKSPSKIRNTIDFQCMNQLEPQLKNTYQKCGEGMTGTIFEAGYQIDIIKKWFRLLTICHDVSKMNTFYSMYTLLGKSIDARQKNVPRPSEFFVGNLKHLFGGISPNKYYTKVNGIKRFFEILRLSNVSEYVDTENKYLSRGHLSPDADMLFSSWKVATYFFINVAPQWQGINAGNWLKVEDKVRKAAAWSQDNLTVITGTYGVMKLKSRNEEKSIYLVEPDKLRVPECFWKVIYHQKSKSAIVIITLNNPYTKEIKPLCNDICESHYWSHQNFHDKQKGYTYCCTYEEFKNVVTFVPQLEVEGVFNMPKKPPIWRFQSAIKKVMKNSRGKTPTNNGNGRRSYKNVSF